jgi:hypothetical protein
MSRQIADPSFQPCGLPLSQPCCAPSAGCPINHAKCVAWLPWRTPDSAATKIWFVGGVPRNALPWALNHRLVSQIQPTVCSQALTESALWCNPFAEGLHQAVPDLYRRIASCGVPDLYRGSAHEGQTPAKIGFIRIYRQIKPHPIGSRSDCGTQVPKDSSQILCVDKIFYAK